MSVLKIVNWDASTMTAKVDGVRSIVGMQGASLGDGLEPGKAVYQTGFLAPMGYTRPTFKGDGNYSLKMLADGWTDLQSYLLTTRGGAQFAEGINGPQCSVKVSFNRDGKLFEVELVGVQFLTPTFSGTDSPDSREPLTTEVKFTCLNRAINGIFDVSNNIVGVSS